MAEEYEKIGIMGGTFNPIHLGHLEIANAALIQYNLDKIWFMPNNIPKYKSKAEILDAKMRIDMINLAIENNAKFELSTFEINRSGYTFTYETLKLLREKNKNHQYYFIMGADSLVSFRHWKNPDIIAKNCIILAACRNNLSDNKIDEYIYSLNDEFSAIIYKIKGVHIDVSSQMIRRYIKEKRNIDNLVSKKVLDYIKENSLYLN